MSAADPTALVSGLVAAGRAAQGAWAALPYARRAAALLRVQRRLAAEADALAEAISRDVGKPRLDALATEVLPAILATQFYRARGKRVCRPRRAGGGSILMFNKASSLRPRPYGVVGVISPWNYPFAIPYSEVVMALLAGNAVVLKVASATLGTGRALAALFADAGLPAGLFAYVELPGSQAGPAFIAAGVDKLFFTGSTAVGRQLMALAAPRLLPLVLELGGNDAAVVRADADLDRAAAGIVWAAFANAGQSCGGAQRILVARSVYDAFLTKLGDRVKALRVGDRADPDSDLGGLISAEQRSAVAAQVDACLRAGAKVYARSSCPDDPKAYPATVLVDAPFDSPVFKEEVFGPVLGVWPTDSDEQALELANDSEYGLTASVWSRDRRTARALAARINAGAAMVNDHLMSHGLAETPWGGYGASGIGRTHGEIGFQEMLRWQVVVDDFLPGEKRAIWWQPYSAKLYGGLRALAAFAGGPRLRDRLAAIPRTVGVFLRYWSRS
jgi:succinate-semialdehyde dehydrogenase/glutarate-semialdehyde dehydrogenase